MRYFYSVKIQIKYPNDKNVYGKPRVDSVNRIFYTKCTWPFIKIVEQQTNENRTGCTERLNIYKLLFFIYSKKISIGLISNIDHTNITVIPPIVNIPKLCKLILATKYVPKLDYKYKLTEICVYRDNNIFVVYSWRLLSVGNAQWHYWHISYARTDYSKFIRNCQTYRILIKCPQNVGPRPRKEYIFNLARK